MPAKQGAWVLWLLVGGVGALVLALTGPPAYAAWSDARMFWRELEMMQRANEDAKLGGTGSKFYRVQEQNEVAGHFNRAQEKAVAHGIVAAPALLASLVCLPLALRGYRRRRAALRAAFEGSE